MVFGDLIHEKNLPVLGNESSISFTFPQLMSPASLEIQGLAAEDAYLDQEGVDQTSAPPWGRLQETVRNLIRHWDDGTLTPRKWHCWQTNLFNAYGDGSLEQRLQELSSQGSAFPTCTQPMQPGLL